MNAKKTQYTDHFGNPICVGDTIVNIRITMLKPAKWEVKEREDGLIYCKGYVGSRPKYIGIDQLLNTSGVRLRCFPPEKK